MTRIATLLTVLWLLGACSSVVRLMPTPTLLTTGESSVLDDLPPIADSTEVEILYATNRMPIGPLHARHYARVRSEQMRLGVATLRIGDDDKTPASLRAMSTGVVAGNRPVLALTAIREMAAVDALGQTTSGDAQEFIAHVDALLERHGKRELLIYVHGANTDFDRAAAQAAQFEHFMGRDAVVMVFAWPSAGTLLRYGRDVVTARNSEAAFATLLDQLARRTRVSHVNVLAYSAGAMIASPGLARAASSADGRDSLRLGEVYYAAPDIDFPQFVGNLPRYERQVRRVTVAVNMGDRALSFAQWRHRISRAGRPNLADIGPEERSWLAEASARDGLDVLSISPDDLPGLPASSHSFWYDHPWVSSDILLKLLFHGPPTERGLVANRKAMEVSFWTFPPDYEQRLPRIVRALAGQRPAVADPSPSPERQ